MTTTEFILPASLVYPIRITEVHIKKGQRLKQGDIIYSFVDGDGKHKAMAMAEDAVVAEIPVPDGSMFSKPATVLYMQPVNGANTGPRPSERPGPPDPETLIRQLDDMAPSKDFTSFKMVVQRHLIEHGYSTNDALILSEQPQVKDRWRKLHHAPVRSAPTVPPEPAVTPRTAPETAQEPPDRHSQHSPQPVQEATKSTPIQATPSNSYFAALIALIVGAASTGVYVAGAANIPLFIVGIVVPLIFAYFCTFLAYMVVRGSKVFLITLSVIGVILNLAILWFVEIWVREDLESAKFIFWEGPGELWEAILYYSTVFQFGYGEITSSDPGIVITGTFLLIMWGFEAVLLASAVVIGCYFASHGEVSTKEGAKRSAHIMRESGLPLMKGLVIGVAKGFLQLAAVAGFVFLVVEYVL